MTSDELRALQAPLKQRYKVDPAAAQVTMSARGRLDVDRVAIRLDTPQREILAGLHPAAGGDGSFACSVEMLLEALVGCAGTTLCAVATALSLPVTGGTITARAMMDFRGTLGVDRSVPVGLTHVEMQFDLESTATPEQLDKLIALTERHCVVLQVLRNPPSVSFTRS
jgi:uncharacterized OsmC-like protein